MKITANGMFVVLICVALGIGIGAGFAHALGPLLGTYVSTTDSENEFGTAANWASNRYGSPGNNQAEKMVGIDSYTYSGTTSNYSYMGTNATQAALRTVASDGGAVRCIVIANPDNTGDVVVQLGS